MAKINGCIWSVAGAAVRAALLIGPAACGHGPYTAGPLCQPGETMACYEGPPGTEAKGACKAGIRRCDDDLEGFGPCLYQVMPTPETCATPEDDDCDGEINEEGDGCACSPGAQEACYGGPPGTEGVGLCAGGTRGCDGGTWGACEGEVVPSPEECGDLVDEDCDGVACAAPQWGLLAGGAGHQTAAAIAAGGADDVLVAGWFGAAFDFGELSLDAAEGSGFYVVKLGAAGEPVWARSFGAGADEEPAAIVADANGDVLVAGFFSQTFTAGGLTLVATGGRDAFVIKLDGRSGQAMWVWAWGQDGDQEPSALAVTPAGDVLVAGTFTGTLACPGGMFACGLPGVASAGGKDAFVMRLDAAGVTKAVRTLGGPYDDAARAVAIDESGQVLLFGQFAGGLQAGDDTLATTGPTDTDLFVVTLAAGDLTPVKALEFGDAGEQIAASAAFADGALFVAGSSTGGVNWGFAKTGAPGASHAFVARLGPSAETSWARAFETGTVTPASIAVGPTGRIAITGVLGGGDVDVGTGPLTDPWANAFVVQLGPGGETVWAKAFGSPTQTAFDFGKAVATAPNGDVLFAGAAASAFDFGLGAQPHSGGYDAAVARFSP